MSVTINYCPLVRLCIYLWQSKKLLFLKSSLLMVRAEPTFVVFDPYNNAVLGLWGLLCPLGVSFPFQITPVLAILNRHPTPHSTALPASWETCFHPEQQSEIPTPQFPPPARTWASPAAKRASLSFLNSIWLPTSLPAVRDLHFIPHKNRAHWFS